MKLSIKKGFSFGLTSGIITTLGLIVGLHSGTHSALVVMGGVLVMPSLMPREFIYLKKRKINTLQEKFGSQPSLLSYLNLFLL